MTGQRRDQSPTRTDVPVVQADRGFAGRGPQLLKYNPVARWSLAETWAYLRERGAPTSELHERGFVSIGCGPCTRAVRPGEHERAGRWWWEATKRECGLPSRDEPRRSLRVRRPRASERRRPRVVGGIPHVGGAPRPRRRVARALQAPGGARRARRRVRAALDRVGGRGVRVDARAPRTSGRPVAPEERQRFVADDAGLAAAVFDGAQTPPAWADPATSVDVSSLGDVEPLRFVASVSTATTRRSTCSTRRAAPGGRRACAGRTRRCATASSGGGKSSPRARRDGGPPERAHVRRRRGRDVRRRAGRRADGGDPPRRARRPRSLRRGVAPRRHAGDAGPVAALGAGAGAGSLARALPAAPAME